MDDQLSTFISKTSSQNPEPPSPRKGLELWGAFFPWLLVIGFVVAIGLTLAPSWMPARELDIVTVVTVRYKAEASPSKAENEGAPTSESPEIEMTNAHDGPVAFQASGWFEPDPYPTLATCLVDGVIRSVEVLEGEIVKKGQILATLIDDDAKLDLKTAQVQLDAQKALTIAQTHRIESIEAERHSLQKHVDVAKAKRDLAAEKFQRLSSLPTTVVAEKFVVEAKLALVIEEAQIKALQARETELQAQKSEQIALGGKIKAELQRAETEVQRRELQRQRTIISSPMDGRVMKLLAAPGQKKMLIMDHPNSATVALLYDPKKLQARMDVPLSEASQLFIGQKVLLKSNFMPEHTFIARVTRLVGEADLQRNTLQVKVSLEQADERLRPDMLCRGEFLAPPRASYRGSILPASSSSTFSQNTLTTTGVPHNVQIYAPLASIVPAPNETQKAMIWKVGPEGKKVFPQEVTLGQVQREEHVLVLNGLRPGDRVVLRPPTDLTAGENFRTRTPPDDHPKP
jgi:HlyD family secretion protein